MPVRAKKEKYNFIEALENLAEEKDMDKEVFINMLIEAIAKAYKREYMSADSTVRVEIDRSTGKIRIFELRTVVDLPEGELADEDLELTLDEAREINPNYQVGDIVETEGDFESISRLVAGQAKQLFRQQIRETEKKAIYDEFISKKDEMVTGIVDRVEPKFAIITIGKTNAFLALKDQIPGEVLKDGDRIKVYVTDVDDIPKKGIHINVSRNHPGLVKRLFESEVDEIFKGDVEIKSVSREPGERSKIAVYTAVENLDPIGACIGQKGMRVKHVVDELRGENIDIVQWSSDPIVYITNALSPSAVTKVIVDEPSKSAYAIVPDNQTSLAIGKKGQNARLAVHLTGWKIDIKKESDAKELGIFDKQSVFKKDIVKEEPKEEILEETAEDKVEEIVEDKVIETVEEVKEVVKEVEEVLPENVVKVDADIIDKINAAKNHDDDDQAGYTVISEDDDYDDDYDDDSDYDDDIDYDQYDEYYED